MPRRVRKEEVKKLKMKNKGGGVTFAPREQQGRVPTKFFYTFRIFNSVLKQYITVDEISMDIDLDYTDNTTFVNLKKV